MSRPAAKELTERELEVMHVFWQHGQLSTAQVRDYLAATGRDLAYTTVATLIRILCDKRFLKQIGDARPFDYRPLRSFEEVSRSMVRDLIDRVFRGSEKQLLLQLVDEQDLSARSRRKLEKLLSEGSS